MSEAGPKSIKDPSDGHQEFEQLLIDVYDELRRIARFHRMNERDNLTLQTTALVHEAYLRVVNSHSVPQPRDGRHMKALTSRIIRRVLVDHARQRNAQKRDPASLAANPDQPDLNEPDIAVDVLDLDAALNRLAHSSKRLERVVELRFFGGLTNQEVATELNLSTRTAERDWQKARMYLLDLLEAEERSD